MKFKTIAKEVGLGLLALTLVVGMYSGCDTPDPQGEFDNFGERTRDDRVVADMSFNNGQQIDFSGTYLLGIVSLLSPTPILLETEVSVNENFEIDFVFQPVKTDVDAQSGTPRADPRTPVGDEIPVSGVQLQEDGTFVVDLGEVSVGGEANPISGSDIIANITLNGSVQSPTFFCGTASGNVFEPIMLPLDGSTMGAVALEGAAITEVMPAGSCTPSTNNTNNDADMGGDMGDDMGMMPLVDACLGTDDQDIITGDTVDQSAEARSCGLNSLGEEDPVAASQVCIEMATGLTTDCSFCYAETVGCSVSNCVAPCGTDAAGAECRLCQEDNGCIARFEECSGVPSNIEDACTNTDDLAIIMDEMVDQSAEAATCGQMSLAEENPVQASRECIVTATGLSPLCSSCYAKTVGCSIENCVVECASDPDSAECATCQEDNGCISDFETCSGLMP